MIDNLIEEESKKIERPKTPNFNTKKKKSFQKRILST